MFKTYEGEILLKESYGASVPNRLYVKPPAFSNITVVEDESYSDVAHWFTRIFLPQGYPDSVSKDYLNYQIWDTAQAFCSTITGTLATQEVLRGVGVGDTSATPLAATVTWVVKDGCGHLGKILFAYSHGTQLDAYSKKWRLCADVLNDAAMCIEMALPYFKNYTTLVLCISTVMKAIVGVAGGATRAAMTQHHAVRGNMADVSAKDSAQETAVNLVASFAALGIITLFGNSLTIFTLMMMLHIIFNYLAVRAVCLRTLNEPRFLQLIDKYLTQEVVDTPCEINKIEPVIFYQLGPNLLDLKMTGLQIEVGCSMKTMIGESMKASHIKNILEVYSEKKYIIYPIFSMRKTYVLLKSEASTEEVLSAYFHAVLLSIITSALNEDSSSWGKYGDRPFALVCRTLQEAEWSRRYSQRQGVVVHEPSLDLLRFVTDLASKEWLRIYPALKQTGWDLSKHLIVVDEWRVLARDNLTSHSISVEKLVDAQSAVDISATSRILQEFRIPEVPGRLSCTIEPEIRLRENFTKQDKERTNHETDVKREDSPKSDSFHSKLD